MSGIVCVFTHHGKNSIDKETLVKMGKMINKGRSSDLSFYSDNTISIAYSPIKLRDDNEKRPIFNETGSAMVVLHGFIYNYDDLRKFLEERQHRFYTNTDDEILIHLYEEYGDKFVKLLDGDFAFVIWDFRKKKLIVGRDRLGIKELFFSINKGNLIFSSDPKSILIYPGMKREVDVSAMIEYLKVGYIPTPYTLFKNIKKMLPGHILIHEKNKTKILKYWDLSFAWKRVSEWRLEKKLFEILKGSVKKRMLKSERYGVALSGGVDSSTIVALLRELTDKRIDTYSVGYEHGKTEFLYSKLVSDKFDTKHHEIIMKADDISLAPQIVWNLRNFHAILGVCLIAYLIHNKIRDKELVFLGCGTETVLFEDRMTIEKITQIKNILPFVIRKRLILLNSLKFLPFKIKKGIKLLATDDPYQMYKVLLPQIGVDEEEIKEFCSTKLKNKKGYNTVHCLPKNYKPKNLAENHSYIRLKFYSDNSMVCKPLKNSQDTTFPYLDKDLIDFNLSNRNIQSSKYLLKKAMKSRLPFEILKRPRVPAVSFMPLLVRDNDDIIRKHIEDLCERGYFDKKMLFRKIKKNDNYYFHQFARLFSLEMFFKVFVDRDNILKPPKKLSL